MGLKAFLAQQRPKFSAGGKYQRLSALYEATEGFLYTPGKVTAGLTHIRDAISLKRVMIIVCIAVLPALLAGVYNVGWQANQAIAAGGGMIEGWRSLLVQLLLAGHDPASVWDNLALGLAYFLPVYLVTLAVGGFWEVLFAQLRGREISEGFLVTSLLFALILPPSIPLWQAALGISFGVVIAKEVFGGTGHNFVNPALAGRAFLYFAYPAQNSGDAVWVAVDAVSSATPLAVAVRAGQNISDSTVMAAIEASGVSWWDAFVGNLPGSTGETSALAILFGAAILLYTRVASWRIMLSGLIGMALLATLYNLLANDANPLLAIPAHWHLVLGGFAFGLVFMATDPVSAAMTNAGKWLYGALIGVMVVLIRVHNPAYPEGTMLAILFANLMAPLIDYCVVRVNINRRRRRRAG
ncbi:MAG: NADH:ubiquinone reductase (Na(+)-transporting) subunit B [Candidatus Polarisedimenticolaceae bacterium]|nr:NADH:ubiquinone reductase (Na(+)-transporting) subunit B [Candidatus Polarisedimenticolaceae bacterium]